MLTNSENKKESLVNLYGTQLLEIAIEQLLTAEQDKATALAVVRILVEASPKVAVKKVKILISIMVSPIRCKPE